MAKPSPMVDEADDSPVSPSDCAAMAARSQKLA